METKKPIFELNLPVYQILWQSGRNCDIYSVNTYTSGMLTYQNVCID